MRRVVFRNKPSRDTLLDFFYENDWTYLREHQPTPLDWQPHHIGWVAGDDDQWQVQYVDDQTAGACYFVIQGPSSADETLIEKEVRSGGFELLTGDEAVREFESARLARRVPRVVKLKGDSKDWGMKED
jgi:hypothetical protein